jgi:hypothetical protein
MFFWYTFSFCYLCALFSSSLSVFMNRFIFLYFCFFLFHLPWSSAQDNFDGSNLTPVSPNAAAFQKYTDIPVSLHSGVPNISVPIGEVKGRLLSCPISLNYHAGGLKVQEEASWVGLGWSLSAGSTITRMVRGLPDECTHFGYNNFEAILDSISNVDLFRDPYAGVSNWEDYYIDGNRYLNHVNNQHQDSEPDLFSYSVEGYSGKFCIFRNEVYLFPKHPIKIEVGNFNALCSMTAPGGYEIFEDEFSLGSITITLPNGNKYYFNDKEITTTQSSGGTQRYISSWLLSRIESELQHG